MTAREYMRNIKILRKRIRMYQEQIERDTILAAGVSGIRYDKDRVQTSPVGDRMTDIVSKIIDTTVKLEEAIHDFQMKEEEAISFLSNLKEEYERALTFHYLDGASWTEVARMMDYDDRYIYELKDKALDELDELLSTTEKI